MDGSDLPTDLELPALPNSVTVARHEAARLADSIGVDGEPVALAVAEAVGNAVLHAYPRGTSGTVRVAFAIDGDALSIVVGDDGLGMRPDPGSRGLGFGLPLMAKLSAGLEIADRSGGGTELRMRFPLAGARRDEVGR
jgi:anti-sigma regulatory factor (Ser/Thr protein kinase)